MDTYFSTNSNCVTCGDCIDACEIDGKNFLTLATGGCDFDGEPLPPMVVGAYEYVPCHHCDGFWENKTPCQLVCKNNAIELSRW